MLWLVLMKIYTISSVSEHINLLHPWIAELSAIVSYYGVVSPTSIICWASYALV
jgi:hypothetical protein